MRSCLNAVNDNAFNELAARLLDVPDIEEGKAFHARALKVKTKIFAMHLGDELVVKLPAERCAELVAGGTARQFESGGRKLREWVSIGRPEDGDWPARADEALAFVRSTAAP